MTTLRISWVLPTTRVPSGRPLTPAEISAVIVELSADGGQNFGQLGEFTPDTLFVDVPEVDFGTWTARATVRDVGGLRSESVVASATIADVSVPGPVELALKFV